MNSHNDYIKHGWDNGKFWVKYGRCEREPLNFRDECIIAADKIFNSTDKKIIIHYSGGIDSEIVCRSFLEANRYFEVCIWRYDNDLNKHDIDYAFEFCKKYNIKCNVINIDIVEFLKQDNMPNHNWWTNMAVHMIKQNDGYQILADGHVNFNHDPMNAIFIPPVLLHTRYYQGEELEAKTYSLVTESQYPYIESYMEEGCSGFFHYTPELMLSAIRDEYIQKWLQYCDLKNIDLETSYPILHPHKKELTWIKGKEFLEIIDVNCTLDVRPFIMYKYWPESQVRPKYTGIDKIRPLMIEKLIEYGDNNPYPQIAFIPVNEVIDGLQVN